MRKQVNEIVKIVAESLPKKIKVLETNRCMSRACSELSNYQRLLICMAYTPCYKLLKIMNEEQIYKLQINQLVKVKCNEVVDGWFIAKVKMINDWTKRVGVVDSNGQFKEYPYRLILSCL